MTAPQTALTDETGRVVFRGTQQPPGGGSLPLARNVGQAEFDFNNAGNGPAALVFGDGDASLVDLTTPTAPLIVAAGVYTYNVTIHTGSSNNAYEVDLLVDDNFYSIHALAQPDIPAHPCTVGITWWCDAGDPFVINLLLTGGDTISGSLYLQRITA